MTPAARLQAAIDVLDEILDGTPAEQALTRWARRSRFAGSKDRAAIRDHVFDALRCKRSFAALGGAETGRGLMLGALRDQGHDPDVFFDGSPYGPAPVAPDEIGRPAHPGAEAGDIPEWLWPEFTRSLGTDADAGAAYLRQRAPVFLRVNAGKASRAEVSARVEESGIKTCAHTGAASALEIISGAGQLRNSEAFRTGLFEFQDVASQAVVDALPLQDGHSVLDYCAGGGGKALAMAARATVRLTAHDAHPQRMQDLPNRAARAGVKITCVRNSELTGHYDLVLCDVPCSGSGSWRRAPAGKWDLTPERLAALTRMQDDVLDRACVCVAESGVLAYATCSVLSVENTDRVAEFIARHPGWHIEMTRHWPLAGGGDGFFLALLRRTNIATDTA